MWRKPLEFDLHSSASEIVSRDYRAARVFRKFGIEYCCGGKFPLEMICASQGIEPVTVMDELRAATREMKLPSDPGFSDWSVDFLIDYIINIHHRYIKTTVPCISEHLEDFILGHEKKMPELRELGQSFNKLAKDILPHLKDEEETVFPYIRQLAHAFHYRESYAVLLVRTLRKPVRKMMEDEQNKVMYQISRLRIATANYTAPEKSCVNHQVIFSRLREFDNDLSQHLFLENDVLFPRVLEMERELLESVAE